jgi:hypothetical protein
MQAFSTILSLMPSYGFQVPLHILLKPPIWERRSDFAVFIRQTPKRIHPIKNQYPHLIPAVVFCNIFPANIL